MDVYLLDWANLLLRWLHVVVAIAWVGSSFYFVLLDNSLTPPEDPRLKELGVTGELWAVLGPNGTGKSTLMRALLGATPWSRGSVRLLGRERAEWEPRGSERHPRGRLGAEEPRVDLVDLLERRHVDQVDGAADRAVERRAGRLADRLEVLQRLPRLIAGRLADELLGLGVERHLAGAEQQVPGQDCVAVRTDGGGRAGRGDGLAIDWHAPRGYSSPPVRCRSVPLARSGEYRGAS